MHHPNETTLLKIKTDVQNWLTSTASSGKEYPIGSYRFSKLATKPCSLDASSLGVDLEKMLGMVRTDEEKSTIANIFDQYQDSLTGFHQESFKHELDSKIVRVEEMSGTYLGFQLCGAYAALGRLPAKPFNFYQLLLNGNVTIEDYLNAMPWNRSPWGAGGWVDSVATMLNTNVLLGQVTYKPILERLFDWLIAKQDKESGMWGSRQAQGLEGLVNGAYHLCRGTFILQKRPIPNGAKVIDSIIELVSHSQFFKAGNGDACHDLDTYYLLMICHRQVPDYKTDVLKRIAQERLEAVLAFQNTDGAFAFFPRKSQDFHNYYKVSESVYDTSDIQGTVFYMTVIKSLCEIAYPQLKVPWDYSWTHG